MNKHIDPNLNNHEEDEILAQLARENQSVSVEQEIISAPVKSNPNFNTFNKLAPNITGTDK